MELAGSIFDSSIFSPKKVTAVLGRIEHEKQLRDSEERFRGLFEEAAVGIALIDPEGIILEANSALTAMFEATRHELQGRRFTELSHPHQRESLETGVQEIIEDSRRRYEIEHRYVREDESVFWGRLTVSRHKGPGAAEAICMIEDVSSRKQYERELKEAKEEAEEASRLKSALLANMSHEIRTPLTSIIGFTGVLKDSLSGSNAEYARLACEDGERLMDTLDPGLELSNLEAGVIQPSTQQIDLVQLAPRTVELSRPEAEAADLSLSFEATEDTLDGRWAPTLVQRALSNLIRNAIEFTPNGGTVTIRVGSSGSNAALEVEDTGVGISDEFRPRRFDAFTQESEGLKRDYEGSGLGLAIVNRLVDLMDGEIEVESTKGGSRFTVILPLNE